MRHLTAFLTLALLPTAAPALVFAQTPSACEQDLTAVLELLAEDYAGYPRFVERWPERLESALAEARAAAADAEGKAFDEALREFLSIFHDGHLLLYSDFSPAVDMPSPLFYAARSPVARPLGADAFLVRVPSFSVSHKDALERLLAEHKSEMQNRALLIIDVRGNTGGGDTTWTNLIAPLYDGPLQRWPVVWRVSEGNAKALEAQAEQMKAQGAAPTMCTAMRDLANEMRRPHEKELVPLGPPIGRSATMPEVWKQPEHVGILIDGSCGSACENFLLAARQSKKVTLFGARTYGAMDFQNARLAPLPSGQRHLQFGMTMSSRLLEEGGLQRGLPPDDPLEGDLLREPEKAVEHVLERLRNRKHD